MWVVLAYLWILTHDCIGSLSIFRVVLLGFVTIDRLFLCSLVQVESNMQIWAEMGVRLTRRM